MILILGGTTEGRLAVKALDEAAKPYYYSTLGQWQEVNSAHGIRLSGQLDSEQMKTFCCENGIRLLIDAAHPFAIALHRNIAQCAETLKLPVIRLERTYPPHTPDIIWCRDYADAVQRMENDGIQRLLALTGVKTISRLSTFWQQHDCWFRVLDRDESRESAICQGFPSEKLVYYETHNTAELIAQICPDAIITKESGDSGGFDEKIQAAFQAGIPVYAIERPVLPNTFLTVTGEYTLRKEVERLLPEFFPLRIGFTTGSCATAASKAALIALLQGTAPESVAFTLPNGEVVSLPVASASIGENEATASVIKDAGDDPDVTNGSAIVATVRFAKEPGIHFLQGEGVGRITLPGIGIPIGEPAINPTPRQMITRELTALTVRGLDVTISVPGGKELAKRTFNPKLGIVDGISIIGTLGVVRPFSLEAFVESIHREVSVCKAIGSHHLVINSGAKSERYIKALLPDLPPQAFIHYGNFIGDTLRIAQEEGMQQVTMGIMLGKAVKLAEGHLNTHSKTVVMNKDFLCQIAQEAGCSASAGLHIRQLTLARELWDLLSTADSDLFFPILMQHCMAVCKPLVPHLKLSLLLIDEKGEVRHTVITQCDA